MRNQLLLATSIIVASALYSCKKTDSMQMPNNSMNMPDNSMNNASVKIDYPALYVVNGQSTSISVIRLSDNLVTETIKLGEMSDATHTGMNMATGISWPHHISLSPDKTKLSIGVPGMDLSAGHGGVMTGTGKIAILDAVKGTVNNVVNLPVMNHNAIYSPNGNEIWTSQMQDMGTVLVYDANSYVLKNTIEVKMMPAEVTFSSDGSMAFVANGGSDTVTVIGVGSKMVLGQIKVGGEPVGAWTGADGNMYVDNEEGKSITVIRALSMTVDTTISLGFMPGIAAYNNAMSELWVTDPDNGKVHWWTKSGDKFTHGGSFDTGAGAHAVAFSQDGMTAYITNQGASSVSVADVMTHKETKEITVGIKPNGIVIKY
ncbi:MAG: hypothetical protein H7329_12850 [Opitutaceae bacterium]|nr:hypothetical protein [Cytophagales bacterium]